MFLRYLLELRVINEDMCIDAYKRAQERNKSFFDFLIKKECLKPTQLTDLIVANLESGTTVGALLKDYLEESKRSELFNEYLKTNQSFYDCLIDLNFITSEKLTSHHEEYKKKIPVKIIKIEDKPVVSETANPFKAEFLKTFSENKLKKIQKLVLLMMEETKKNGQASNYLNSFYQELHLIHGAATLAGVQTLSKYLANFEEDIEKIIQQEEAVVHEWINLNHATLDKFIAKTWEYRQKESA